MLTDAIPAFYRTREGDMLSNSMPSIYCMLERGHKGDHACTVRSTEVPGMVYDYSWEAQKSR